MEEMIERTKEDRFEFELQFREGYGFKTHQFNKAMEILKPLGVKKEKFFRFIKTHYVKNINEWKYISPESLIQVFIFKKVQKIVTKKLSFFCTIPLYLDKDNNFKEVEKTEQFFKDNNYFNNKFIQKATEFLKTKTAC